MISGSALEITIVILLIFSAIFLTLWICFKQSRSQQKEQGASNLAESEKKLTDAEIHIMLLVTPQIFEASYGIKKEQKKRRMHKYCTKYLVKSPSSKEPSPKLPNQKIPCPKLTNQILPIQNIMETNKKPMVRMTSCSQIEIDCTNL